MKQGGSYLTYTLKEETYGIHVGKVINILEMTGITRVPKTPEYIKGVINLRGTVLPVIDTRIKFGMDAAEDSKNTCILVLEPEIDGKRVMVGAVVDSVKAVVEITEDRILQVPSIGKAYKTDFLSGMIESNDKFIMLVNIDKVFNTSDMETINMIRKTGPSETKKPEPAKVKV